ncbi:MAG TPA: electron transfer flavoprotein subunit beta/FixA family protein [Desulfosporosinus sp.]|nr:electron transfer flavoprotein subunit beta/FixA family protein [Desulfosporosinus sp.]
MINPYDESALELALKLHDAAMKNNVELNLSALTIGSKGAERFLKNLYALKYIHAVRIDCDLDLRFNATMVSKIIYQYLNVIRNHEVIILGNQSSEGDNAKTPLLVAERLGIPAITSVTNIKLSKQAECLEVTSTIDEFVIEQTIMPPVVLVIGNVANSYIRIPTLKDKMQCSKKQIQVYDLTDLEIGENEIEGNDSELIELVYKRNERDCVFVQGENASGKVDVLYQNYLKERVKL